MRKFLFLILVMLVFNTSAVLAETVQIKVSALEEFKTDNPSKSFNVKIQKDVVLGDYNLKEGDTLECSVLETVNPKRGKQNASFYVKPLSYISNGQISTINNEYYGKYSKTVMSMEELKQIPPSSIIKKTALTVGNHFVKGLSSGVYFAEGVVKNEDGKPIRSGLKKVYKESPLSYVEKGQELDLKEGDVFYLVFKITQGEEPNYSYTESN